MLYIDHSIPRIKAILSAQDILRAARTDKFYESTRTGNRKERVRSMDAALKLDRALNHLSEEVRCDPSCWLGTAPEGFTWPKYGEPA